MRQLLNQSCLFLLLLKVSVVLSSMDPTLFQDQELQQPNQISPQESLGVSNQADWIINIRQLEKHLMGDDYETANQNVDGDELQQYQHLFSSALVGNIDDSSTPNAFVNTLGCQIPIHATLLHSRCFGTPAPTPVPVPAPAPAPAPVPFPAPTPAPPQRGQQNSGKRGRKKKELNVQVTPSFAFEKML